MSSLSPRGQGYGGMEEALLSKALSAESLAALSSEAIALHATAPVKDGKALLNFDLPVFNGEMHLAVVLSGKDTLVKKEGRLTVREPLVVQPSLPVYLRENERLRASVSLDNTDLKGSSQIQFSVKCQGSLSCDLTQKLDLSQGHKLALPLDLTALSVGQGTVEVTAQAGDYRYARSFTLPVLSAFSPALYTSLQYVTAGQSATFEIGSLFKSLKALRGSHPDVGFGLLLQSRRRLFGFGHHQSRLSFACSPDLVGFDTCLGKQKLTFFLSFGQAFVVQLVR